MTSDDPRATARSILRDVRTDPTAADVSTLHELLEVDDQKARRSALDALRTVASRDPPLFRAEFESDLEAVHSLCSDPDATVRTGGADLLTTIAAAPTASPPSGAIDSLSTLLDDDSRLVRRQTLDGLEEIGAVDSERVRPFVDDVAPFLESDDPAIREHAVVILAQAASADGTSVRGIVSTLFELLQGDDNDDGAGADTGDDDVNADANRGTTIPPSAIRKSPEIRKRFEAPATDRLARRRLVRQLSGHAICQLAIADPDAVLPRLETLVTLLADDDPQVRTVAIETILALANSRPAAVVPYRTTLATRLESDGAETVRGRLAQTLAALGVDDPALVGACVVDAADALWPLLEHDEPPVRGGAANLLALAGSTPTAADSDSERTDSERRDIIGPATDRLETLLDDDVEYVRAAAADALKSGRQGSDQR